MSFSVYTGGSASSGYVYADTNVIDNSWGCSHSGYWTQATLRSPGGRSNVNRQGGLHANASLAIGGDFGSYDIEVHGQYFCACLGGYGGFGGGQTVPVQRPAFVELYSQGNGVGLPMGCSVAPRYYKVRDYQVKDTAHQPIYRTMYVNEFLTTDLNTCGTSNYFQGGGPTSVYGTFRDNFFLCGSVPGCDGGGSCAIVRQQAFAVDSTAVQPNFTIAYSCSGVTVQ